MINSVRYEADFRKTCRALIRAAFAVVLSCMFSGITSAEVPSIPSLLPVPPSGREPLSSANRAGTEYMDLRKVGYAEEEYYLYGASPAITAAGEVLFNAPYSTRILVRYPQDAERFNGTVVIEPFTWIGERSAGWILTKEYLLRKGYAWVGYTISINKPAYDPKTTTDPTFMPDPEPANMNLDWMRRFDYKRYAPLGFYYDPSRFRRGGHADEYVPQAQGIAAQIALLLKMSTQQGPLHGLKVERVYVNSWAVTSQVWMDYLDQGRHQQWRMSDGKPLIDAYMTGRYPFGGAGGGDVRVPRYLPEDAPYVNVFTESEVMDDANRGVDAAADSDHPRFRYYEVVGMSHLRTADLGTEETEDFAADVGKGDDFKCQHVYDEPAEMIVSALFDDMDRWVREGIAMPKAPRVIRQDKGVKRDSVTGNMIGGVRPPWITVPAAAYMTEYETGCGMTYDTKIPYTSKQMAAMYKSYVDYVRRFEAAKAMSIKEGYLLPADADRLMPVAKQTDFPSTASPR